MSTSTFITNRVKDNKNIYHSSGGINVSYDNKMNWLGRWDKIMNALTYMFGTFFFNIYVEEYIYKDLTNLKNDAKYKETYWKAFDQISHLSIFLDIKDYSWNTWNYKWQISKNSTRTSKSEIGILNFDGL